MILAAYVPNCLLTILGAHGLEDLVGITMQEITIPVGEDLFTFYEETCSGIYRKRYFIPAPDCITSKTPAVKAPVPDSIPSKDRVVKVITQAYTPRDGLGIDRPPTPFPMMETTPQRQASFTVYSEKQLEAAHRLSPKLPAPDPSDPIFYSNPTPILDFDPTCLKDPSTLNTDKKPVTMTIHTPKAVKPELSSSMPTPENERPATSYVPGYAMPISGLNSHQPYATTAPAHAFARCSNILSKLTVDEHALVLEQLLENYYTSIGDTERPVIWRKPAKNGSGSDVLTLTEKMDELGKNLDRIDNLAKENNRQMRDALSAYQAVNGASTMGDVAAALAFGVNTPLPGGKAGGGLTFGLNAPVAGGNAGGGLAFGGNTSIAGGNASSPPASSSATPGSKKSKSKGKKK